MIFVLAAAGLLVMGPGCGLEDEDRSTDGAPAPLQEEKDSPAPKREAWEPWIQDLHSEDEAVADRAADELIKIGEDAVPAVSALLGTAPLRVQKQVLYILEKLGPRASASIPKLMAILNTSPDDLWMPACEALTSMGPKAVRPLLEYGESAGSFRRKEARIALNSLEAKGTSKDAIIQEAQPFYLNLLRTGGPSRRKAALSGLLWTLPPPEARKDIEAFLEDDDGEVRMLAKLLLKKLKSGDQLNRSPK